MKLRISIPLVVSTACLSTLSAVETPIFEEDFSGAPVVTWDTRGNDAVLTLNNPAQQLELTGSGDRTLFTSFSAENLAAVGSSMRASFSFNVSDPTASTSVDRAFRFGLWDESNSRAGYLGEIDLFSATGTSFETLANDGNGTRLGGAGLRSLDGIVDPAAFVGNGVDHDIEFSITRTSATDFSISAFLDGQLVVTSTDAVGNLANYDTFGFRITDVGSPVLNLTEASLFVDPIPEPSAIVLLLLGLSSLTLRRSRSISL